MRSKWGSIVAMALLGVVGAAIWFGRDTYASARIGTVYVAKQACSCLFVARRTMDSCMTDYDSEQVKPLRLEVNADSVEVAALGGVVSAKARFEEGFGCHPVD